MYFLPFGLYSNISYEILAGITIRETAKIFVLLRQSSLNLRNSERLTNGIACKECYQTMLSLTQTYSLPKDPNIMRSYFCSCNINDIRRESKHLVSYSNAQLFEALFSKRYAMNKRKTYSKTWKSHVRCWTNLCIGWPEVFNTKFVNWCEIFDVTTFKFYILHNSVYYNKHNLNVLLISCYTLPRFSLCQYSGHSVIG